MRDTVQGASSDGLQDVDVFALVDDPKITSSVPGYFTGECYVRPFPTCGGSTDYGFRVELAATPPRQARQEGQWIAVLSGMARGLRADLKTRRPGLSGMILLVRLRHSWGFRHCLTQRHHGPACAGCRDELILP